MSNYTPMAHTSQFDIFKPVDYTYPAQDGAWAGGA
jgi:hypothetical protein